MGAYIARSGVFTWAYMRRVRHANMTLLGRLCIASWRFFFSISFFGTIQPRWHQLANTVFLFFALATQVVMMLPMKRVLGPRFESIFCLFFQVMICVMHFRVLTTHYCTVQCSMALLPLLVVAAVNWGSPCTYTDVVVARVHDLIGKNSCIEHPWQPRRSAMNTVYKSRFFFIPVEDCLTQSEQDGWMRAWE